MERCERARRRCRPHRRGRGRDAWGTKTHLPVFSGGTIYHKREWNVKGARGSPSGPSILYDLTRGTSDTYRVSGNTRRSAYPADRRRRDAERRAKFPRTYVPSLRIALFLRVTEHVLRKLASKLAGNLTTFWLFIDTLGWHEPSNSQLFPRALRID